MNTMGKIGEGKWRSHLESLGYSVEEAPNRRFYDWDLKGAKEGTTHTFEVKYDEKAYWWANKRGTPDEPNLYIEYKNTTKNEDSGILASKSDFYVYIIKGEIDTAYLFHRLKLSEHLTSSDYKTAGNSLYGDDNALGWIPPLSKLVKHDSFIKSIDLLV